VTAFLRLQELRTARDEAVAASGGRKPSPSRRDVLAAARARYDRCRNALALEFTGLVKSRAKRWVCQGADLEDLCQEGQLGLLQALDGYDTSSEPTTTTDRKRFMNYAIPFIDSAIAQSRPRNTLGRLSIGEHSVRYAERVAKTDAEAWKKTGEVEKEEAVAVATPGRRHALETIQAMRAFKRGVRSLEETVEHSEGGRELLKDRLEDSNSPNPEELYAEKEERTRLIAALDNLEPAEARVVRWRFGLGDVG
jgi:RNA polymerase primary sigma factor